MEGMPAALRLDWSEELQGRKTELVSRGVVNGMPYVAGCLLATDHPLAKGERLVSCVVSSAEGMRGEDAEDRRRVTGRRASFSLETMQGDQTAKAA